MSWHIVHGKMYSGSHSEQLPSYTPIEKITGPHWGVWVFDIQQAKLAIPPPWGDFTRHEEMDGRPFKVAIVGYWPDGFLGRQGNAGKGYGRVYLDLDTGTRDVGELQAQFQTLERQITTGTLDAQPDEPLRQMAVIRYVFNDLTDGPFAAFNGLAMAPTRLAPITITSVLVEHNVDQDEPQQFVIKVGDVGKLKLQPLRGANGQIMRLLHAQPALRDDILLAQDLGSAFIDEDVFPADATIHADMPNPGTGEIRDCNWQWAALDGPPITTTAPGNGTAPPES